MTSKFGEEFKSTFSASSVFKNVAPYLAFLTFATLIFRQILGFSFLKSLVFATIILIILFAVLTSFSLLKSYLRLRLVGRKSNYGDIIISLKDFFSKINLLRKLDTIRPELLKPALEDVCNDLQKNFNTKTNSTCCVSIKMFSQIAGGGDVDLNSAVYNLCRNESSIQQRDSDIYGNIDHTIYGNTPYLKITNDLLNHGVEAPYYINSNIPKAIKNNAYLNTSQGAYPNGVLPYKSEIVIPILPIHNPNDQKPDLIGFICVDSNKTNSFNETYDLPMLQGFADGVYDVIMKWKFKENK